jgi:hypothetical protein
MEKRLRGTETSANSGAESSIPRLRKVEDGRPAFVGE